MRRTVHGFPPGLSRWKQQLAATRFGELPRAFRLGRSPKRRVGRGRLVAASRGSTGTRPVEAQGRLKALDFRQSGNPHYRAWLSTGFIPVGAAIGSYGRFERPCFFGPLGLRPNERGGWGGGAMGSCQSWLHRHKAGGGRTLR